MNALNITAFIENQKVDLKTFFFAIINLIRQKSKNIFFARFLCDKMGSKLLGF